MKVKTVQNIMQGFGLVNELPAIYEMSDDKVYLIQVEEDVKKEDLERLAQHLVLRGAPNFVLMAGTKATVTSKTLAQADLYEPIAQHKFEKTGGSPYCSAIVGKSIKKVCGLVITASVHHS